MANRRELYTFLMELEKAYDKVDGDPLPQVLKFMVYKEIWWMQKTHSTKVIKLTKVGEDVKSKEKESVKVGGNAASEKSSSIRLYHHH